MKRRKPTITLRIQRFIERQELKWSKSKMIDGMWIGILDDDLYEPIILRIEASLELIRQFDPVRYKRLTLDLDRIWVNLAIGGRASYHHNIRTCKLDERYIMADTTTKEEIASSIVHEATHARLMNCGIGYEEELRTRVEAVCVRQEWAFAAKLPNGQLIQQQAEESLDYNDDKFYQNTAVIARNIEGHLEILHYIGMPNFIIKLLMAIRKWKDGLSASSL